MLSKFFNIFKNTYSLMPIEIKKLFILMIIASFVIIIIETVSFSIFIPLLDQILNEGANRFFKFDQVLTYFNINKEDFISSFLIFILFVFIFKSIILIQLNKFKIKFLAKIEKYVSNKVVENFLEQEFENYKAYSKSKINKELILDISRYCALIDSSIGLFIEMTMTILIVFLLILVDPLSTLIIIISLIGVSAVYLITTRQTFFLLGENSQKSENTLIQSVNEISKLFKEIKIFEVKQKFLLRFKKALNERVQHVVNYRINIFLPRILIELFVVAILVLLFFILLRFNNSNNEIFLILGLLSIASFKIMPSIVKSLNYLNVIKYADASVNILNEKLETIEKKPKQNIVEKYNKNMNFRNKIELVNLKFNYKNSSSYILNNISIEINKGDHIGIIGESGSGKSTLLDIIMQFQTEFEGKYLFDGLDVKKNKIYNNKSFFKNFGYVGQNTELMNDTIRNNIIFSSNENIADQDRLEKSINLSQMKKIYDEQNLGLERIISDNSFNISGGQKQRLALARALYSNCSVLILDEITSSLDEINQEKIMMDIKMLKKEGKTIIQTTHNLKHLKYFDKVINLTNTKS